jgi:hypothetical protein
MPIAGIVDVEPDGKTAKGCWYGFFLGAMPRPVEKRALIGVTIWENDYYREVKTGQGSVCEAPPSEVYGLPVFSTA